MTGKKTVFAMVNNGEDSGKLSEVAENMAGTQVDIKVGTLAEVRPNNEDVGAPDALLLAVDPKSEGDLDELRSIISSRYAQTPVIVTAKEPSARDVRNFVHMGAADVLPEPYTADELKSSLKDIFERVAAEREPEVKTGGKIITFLKGGGGVGATTMAVHMACDLASRNQDEKANVCILDFDVQFGTAALYLDLESKVGLGDLLEAPERLDVELFEGSMREHDCGVKVLAAPREVMPLDMLTPEFITDCLRLAKEQFEYVLIDLPPVWTVWSYTTLRDSDLTLLTTQLNVAGVRQAKRQIDTLKLQDLGTNPLKVVLNRSEKGIFKSRQLKAAESALGHPVDFFIPDEPEVVAEALDRGVPIFDVKKGSKFGKAISGMNDAIIDMWADRTSTARFSGGRLSTAPRLARSAVAHG